MRLLTVSLAGWLTGTVVFVLVAAAPPFKADSLAVLAMYGAFFSALPAIIAYWLILVPMFSVLRRRQATPFSFVALAVGLCLCAAVLSNTLLPTASGPFSGEAMRFYVVFGLVGIVLGVGYLWSHKGGGA